METRIERARAYSRAIRNTRKREYAIAFMGYLLGKRSEPETSLSYMAAQAVRLRLAEILGTLKN